jgi:hypothetical protein
MLQCGTCTTYPMLAEEAHEDAGAKKILFHVYDYKVLFFQDSKKRRHLKLVQKRATIGEFHYFFMCQCSDVAAIT